MFTIGALGRPNVVRVFLPLFILFVLLPLIGNGLQRWWRQLGAVTVLIACVIVNGAFLYERILVFRQTGRRFANQTVDVG